MPERLACRRQRSRRDSKIKLSGGLSGGGRSIGPMSFAGRESLTVQFLGPGRETVLYCYVHDLYDGQQMRPEKLDAWRALRQRYGNRDESRVDRGALLAPAA